ncbi:MAG: hypothetical protein H0T53_00180 [Herpetosiphonaceae bacterium]|nr:hypothetical protein [Herpetosiphonaceae bacterium]
MIKLRTVLIVGGGLFLLACGLLGLVLPPAVNPVWQIAGGVYRYDPRAGDPAPGLLRDRPEDSLHYYLDATLLACDGRHPHVSELPVQRYEVQAVTYDGRSSYHATSLVQARLFYADATSRLVTFRFEAGHNEGDWWYLEHGSTVRAGSWLAVGGLVASPDAPPPGWRSAPGGPATACDDVSPPFRIE